MSRASVNRPFVADRRWPGRNVRRARRQQPLAGQALASKVSYLAQLRTDPPGHQLSVTSGSYMAFNLDSIFKAMDTVAIQPTTANTASRPFPPVTTDDFIHPARPRQADVEASQPWSRCRARSPE